MYKLGILWDKEVKVDREEPAKEEWRNKDLKLYTEIANQNKIELYNTNFSQYKDGQLQKAWYWNGEEWEIREEVSIDAIYDKFKYTDKTRKVKKSISKDLQLINRLELEKICMDKLKTYQKFSEYVPETRRATKENAEEMLQKNQKIVMKPRYGYGGEGISKIENSEKAKNVCKENYILQEFVKTKGLPKYDVEGYHDLRVVLINDEMRTSYLRIPDDGFRSNVDQGGSLNYVELDEISEKVKQIVREVDNQLEDYKPRLYTIDFIFNDNLEPKIMELNSKPSVYCYRPYFSEEREKPNIKKLFNEINTALSNKNS